MNTKALSAICLAAVVAFAGCKKSDSSSSDLEMTDPTEQLPEKYKTQEPVPKPDFSEAAKSPAFQQAIKDAAALLGSQPQPLQSPAEDEPVNGGVSFNVPENRLERILRKAHTDYLSRGFYLFRYDQNFGIGNNPDRVGLLPTTDKYAVMAAMDTNGDNYEIGTAGVIAWMKDLEHEQPYVLTGIGFDYMEGYFIDPVKDPQDLARRMYQFCPDIVDQGVGSVRKLVSELGKGDIYFWWD